MGSPCAETRIGVGQQRLRRPRDALRSLRSRGPVRGVASGLYGGTTADSVLRFTCRLLGCEKPWEAAASRFPLPRGASVGPAHQLRRVSGAVAVLPPRPTICKVRLRVSPLRAGILRAGVVPVEPILALDAQHIRERARPRRLHRAPDPRAHRVRLDVDAELVVPDAMRGRERAVAAACPVPVQNDEVLLDVVAVASRHNVVRARGSPAAATLTARSTPQQFTDERVVALPRETDAARRLEVCWHQK